MEEEVDQEEVEESEIVDALKNGNNVVAFFCKYWTWYNIYKNEMEDSKKY